VPFLLERRSTTARGGLALRGVLPFFAAVALSACGLHEPPPRLPSAAIHDRTASRVELVDFVISDRERARRVRALYEEIDAIMRDAQRVEARELAKVGTASLHGDDELRSSVTASRDAELAALDRYVSLELQIRALTTPEEFARLNRIR
jgi:hypothetical protein